MHRRKIYLASPSGDALTAEFAIQRVDVPRHGMYRLELDARGLLGDGAVADILANWLVALTQSNEVFLSLSGGPSVELGQTYIALGRNQTGEIFSTSAPVTRESLENLTTLPFGEVTFFASNAGAAEVRVHLAEISDWESILVALRANAEWAIAFDNDSGTLAFLSRHKATVDQQAVLILAKEIEALK